LFYQNVWFKRVTVVLFLALFFLLMYFSIANDSSSYLIGILSERSFPFKIILLEGVPGLSQPEREYIDDLRYKVAALGMFLLTGVNISDPRTYFLSFYAPPRDGSSWLGWAYSPNDPEMEGLIMEPLGNPFYNEPAPITSEHDALIGVYHTHNAESYAGSGGRDRAESGKNGDIVKVGELLVHALNQKGVKTIHDTTVNDADYTRAYDRANRTAQKMLEVNPTIRLLLDIHRDGLPPEVGKSTININGRQTARIMIIIGQKNPNWEKNNQVALELIEIAEKKYPGLFFSKVRYASEARYNQHLTDGAILLEVGSQLNTSEEALAAAEPMAEVLKEYLEK